MRVITRMNIGGPAIHVALLTGRLDPSRFETLLVSGREGASEGSMLELGRLPEPVRPLRVETLGRAVSPFDDIRALARVVRIARRFRPHVVHTHLAKAGFVGRLAARASGARVVVHTYHGSVLRGYFGRAESALYLGVERTLARLSTRIIAISESGRRELIELGVAPDEKIVVVPLGLDLERFRDRVAPADARRALGLGSGPTVGIVARLVPIKDVATFIRAAALARATVPDLVAVVVGDGEQRAELERLAADLAPAGQGRDGWCRFLGWRSDLPTVVAALDVVALSSLNEGSPVSLIEAMAAGRAVLATAVGGVPDVIRTDETGVLVPPRDPAALARAMVRLLRDVSLRERLGLAAAASVHPRYDASRLLADIERLYLELLRGAAG